MSKNSRGVKNRRPGMHVNRRSWRHVAISWRWPTDVDHQRVMFLFTVVDRMARGHKTVFTVDNLATRLVIGAEVTAEVAKPDDILQLTLAKSISPIRNMETSHLLIDKKNSGSTIQPLAAGIRRQVMLPCSLSASHTYRVMLLVFPTLTYFRVDDYSLSNVICRLLKETSSHFTAGL